MKSIFNTRKKSVEIEHYAFRVSIILKGIESLLELISGFLLLFINASAIQNFIYNLFAKELAEDPHSFIATTVVHWASQFSSSVEWFLALYFLTHGIIKSGLLVGLWYEKIKLYPVAIGIFVLFIFYQVYKYIMSPSGWLIYLTVLDLIFIGLAILEWRHLKEKLIRGS